MVSGEGPGVVVVGGVGYDEHGGVNAAPLHLFPRRTTFGTATPVVPSVSHTNTHKTCNNNRFIVFTNLKN